MSAGIAMDPEMKLDSRSVLPRENRVLQPKWLVVTVAILLSGLGLLYLVDQLFHPGRFPFRHIEIQGDLQFVTENQVQEVVRTSLTGNYFSASLPQLEAEVGQLPWVSSATLGRQWPSTLVVEIEEMQPVARWGEEQWLKFGGGDPVIVSPIQGVVQEAGLPRLDGNDRDAPLVWKTFQHWSEKLSSNGLVVDEISLHSRGLWTLRISRSALRLNTAQAAQSISGEMENPEVEIVVDQDNADVKLDRLIAALNQGLMSRFPEMKKIDLRYANGFAVRFRGSSPGSGEPGAEPEGGVRTGTGE